MKLVADANILFAALIKDGFTVTVLFADTLELFTPEFIIEVFLKHEQFILKKTKRSKSDFLKNFHTLQQIITTVPKEEYLPYFPRAKIISPDPNDVAYFALALTLDCPIWSNDKAQKEQEFVRVFSTQEVRGIL